MNIIQHNCSITFPLKALDDILLLIANVSNRVRDTKENDPHMKA